MKSRSIAKLKVMSAIAVLVAGTVYGANPNASTPGRVLIDNPTVHNLAFRWLYEGDANANASADVRYRIAGADAEWRAAQPLRRVKHSALTFHHDEPVDVPAFLAGSILDLEPGTAYEVELSFRDPDGGETVERVTVSTRPEPPENLPGRRTLRVYPEDYADARENGFDSLAAAFAAAQAGDLVLLAPGEYAGPLTVTAAGAPDAPIIFRADGGVLIDGRGDMQNPVITLEQGADFIHFEGLEIKSGRVGIRGMGNRGIVIRRCLFENLRFGVATAGEPDWKNEDWYIADNVFVGHRGTTAAINLAGRGHVACHNSVTGGRDGIGTAHVRHRDIDPMWAVAPDAPQHAIDIYNNDVSETSGAAIAAEHVLSNIRVMRNRAMNGVGQHCSGISIRPSNVGPVYVIRNLVIAWPAAAWRLMGSMGGGLTGILAYHNTTRGAGPAITQYGAALVNCDFRNNAMHGEQPAMWRTASGPGQTSVIDHNGYGPVGIRFFDGFEAQKGVDFANPRAFHAATGHEAGGVTIRDWAYIERLGARGIPSPRSRCEAVNAGIRLANINDGFTGDAPDVGALDRGAEAPVYGPRPAGR